MRETLERPSGLRREYVFILHFLVILAGLYLISLYNYLLFHSLAEIFSIVVACAVFMIAFNARRTLDNHCFLLIGIASLSVAALDLVHTLAYKGMGVFPRYDANLPTQLWIAARYVQSVSLLIAPLFCARKLRATLTLMSYVVVTFLLLTAIFFGIFPDCFVEGVGLTPFKKVSEYVISLILLVSIALLIRQRTAFDSRVLRQLVLAIVATVGAELAFTFYVSVYGLSNLIGHLFKIVSFYLLYRAIVQTGINQPHDLLFRRLKLSQEELAKHREHLEELVQARTTELRVTNEQLQREIVERRSAEDALAHERDLLHIIMDRVPDTIYFKDTASRFMRINRSQARVLGVNTPEEAIGKTDFDFFDEAFAREAYADELEVVRSKQPVVGKIERTRTADKHVCWFSTTKVPIVDEEGRVTGVVGISRDITELKQAEEQVSRHTVMLEAVNAVLRESLTCETDEEVARTCLAVAQELTGSKFGFVGELNDAGLFDTTAITNPGWDACKVPRSDAIRLTKNMELRGVDRATLREGESRIVNDLTFHPDSVGIPEGHPPVTCFLGMPLKQAGRTIGMIGLANKESGYDLADQEAVETLSAAFVEALMRKRIEEGLRASKERYRALVDTSPVAVVTTDLEGRITYLSQRALELYGAESAEALLGKRIIQLIAPEEHGRATETMKAALTEEVVRGSEFSFARRDGTRFVGELNVGRLDDFAGEPMSFVAVIRDVTERRQAEEDLQKLAQIVEHSRELVGLSTLDQKVVFLNESGARMLGVTPEEAARYTIMDFVPEEFQEQVEQEILPGLMERSVWQGDLQYKNIKTGERTDVSATAFVIPDPHSGQSLYLANVSLDITERVRAEEEQERLLVAERAQRLLAEALREVAAAVNSSLELQEVLSLALNHLSRLVECDSAVVMLRAGDGLEVVARWSVDPEREPQVPPQIETLPHVACVLGECQPVIIPDTVGDERWIEVPGSEYVRCWLGVPLIVQEKAIGLLGLNYHQPGFYTQEHADLALAVASQAASAIENARLFEETQRRAAQHGALLRSAGRLNARLELESVLETIGEETMRAFGVSGASVYLYDPERQVLTCAGASGLSSEQRQRLPLVPRALYDKFSRQGETPIVIPDVQVVPGLPGSELFAELNFRTNVTALMEHGGELIGALNATTVDEVRSFSDDELALLQGLADQVAMAIANTRLLKAAREQAQQVQQILRTVPEGIVLLGAALRVLVVNPVGGGYLEALTDVRPGDVLAHLSGRPMAELLSPPVVGRWHTIEAEGPPSRVFEVIAQPMGGEAERSGWVLVLRDVTEERQMEAQMRQQDRLAVIGQLAGGVAHDFNNVLTAIQGYSEFVLSGLASDDPQDWPPGREMRADLGEVVKAAERAAGLTRQLLAFSRRQILQPQVLDLNAVIAGFEQMLRRLLGAEITLVTFPAPELGRVEADPGQIEQVIMNLAVNARDAMPGGGQLTLETANVTLDRAYAQAHIEVEPGPYVMLAVSDTGIGMGEEVKAHIFEPFFTTKEKDKGTGLGLSVVHGIVKQSGGHIAVYSEPGVGTTFKVYLPRLERETEVAEQARASRVPLGGTETILVAEDEETVRALACRVLREHGYTVLEFGHPEDALRLASGHEGPIHLLLTDVVMPGMSRRELAERLSPSHPGVAVLYISGYTDNAIVHHGVLDAGTPFLQKPFNALTLTRKVREVLDASLPGELVEQSHTHLDVQSLRAGVEVPETPAVSLTHESVTGLPADLVAEMREATINADIDRLNKLIDRVETHDAQVAAALRALANRYQNDALLDLFDAGEGKP